MTVLVPLTLMNGEVAYFNPEHIVAVFPTSDEDRETRPHARSLMLLSTGGGEKLVSVRDLPTDIPYPGSNNVCSSAGICGTGSSSGSTPAANLLPVDHRPVALQILVHCA